MSAQSRFTRRQALKLMGVGTFSAYLAACAAPAGQSDMADSDMPAGEKKAISISHIGGGSVEASEKSQRMMLLRANFPDIEFENRWVSYAAYLDKIPVQIASGDLADLQFCNAFNDIPLMMENQILIETGPLLEQVGQNILAVTPELAWASTVYDASSTPLLTTFTTLTSGAVSIAATGWRTLAWTSPKQSMSTAKCCAPSPTAIPMAMARTTPMAACSITPSASTTISSMPLAWLSAITSTASGEIGKESWRWTGFSRA